MKKNKETFYVGKFLLVFIAVCGAIFYLPYKIGAGIGKYLSISEHSCAGLVGHFQCWYEGAMMMILIGLLIALVCLILLGIVVITFKIMERI